MRALLLAAIFLTGTAFADDQVRKLPDFDSIKSKSAFNISVEVGQSQSLTVRGSEKFASHIITEVIGRELVISYKEKKLKRIDEDDAEIIITVPTLTKLRFEGAGKTRIDHIDNEDFYISYEGAGMLVASGKTKNLVVNARGIGLVDTRNLIADQVNINVEGIGTVNVYAKEKLYASVQGIGNLNYYGRPKTVNKTVDGIGSIRAAD